MVRHLGGGGEGPNLYLDDLVTGTELQDGHLDTIPAELVSSKDNHGTTEAGVRSISTAPPPASSPNPGQVGPPSARTWLLYLAAVHRGGPSDGCATAPDGFRRGSPCDVSVTGPAGLCKSVLRRMCRGSCGARLSFAIRTGCFRAPRERRGRSGVSVG